MARGTADGDVGANLVAIYNIRKKEEGLLNGIRIRYFNILIFTIKFRKFVAISFGHTIPGDVFSSQE